MTLAAWKNVKNVVLSLIEVIVRAVYFVGSFCWTMYIVHMPPSDMRYWKNDTVLAPPIAVALKFGLPPPPSSVKPPLDGAPLAKFSRVNCKHGTFPAGPVSPF